MSSLQSDEVSEHRPHVSADPRVLSGTPCLAGTRLPVFLIAEVVWAHGVNEALELWDITRKDVLVACWYAGAYGTVYLWPGNDDDENDDLSSPSGYRENPVDQVWLDRWREWAQEAAKSFWRGEYDPVPDPPSESSGEPPVRERTC